MTKDVELKTTQNGLAVATVTLAIDRPRKPNAEKQTDFPRCTVFGKQAENMAKYVCSGCRVAIVGRIQTGSYQNKEGVTVYTTDVFAEKVEFLDFKPKDQDHGLQGAPAAVPQPAPAAAPQGAPQAAPQGAPQAAPQGAPAPAEPASDGFEAYDDEPW